MTKLLEAPRCAHCRRPLTARTGAGRPSLYCRRAHRQRAYEARRRAALAQLPDGEVVVARGELDRLHDLLYALEAALDDVDADLGDLGAARRGARAASAYADALTHLRDAAMDLRGFVLEPVTT